MEDKSKKYNKKGRALLIASLFVLALSALGIYYFIFAPDWHLFPAASENSATSVPKIVASVPTTTDACSGCQPRWLDGVLVPAAKATAFPVAIMIDNDVLARPQDGLARASLVYEAPVEGGMTRYLAVFPADADIAAVGPVRSARPYFVAWASELQALFIHCGGSPEALTQIKQSPLHDLNEFYNSSYFWRESGKRQAPHNLLTSGDNWRAYLSKNSLATAQASAWQFKNEEKPAATTTPDITLRFSANFKAMWRYEAAPNEYRRFFNGTESTDEGTAIKAKNIIIHYLNSKVLDDHGRLRLDTNGRGKAQICLDGVCRWGNWKKTGRERTRYYYDNGEEIKLNPGITWIEVSDENTTVD